MNAKRSLAMILAVASCLSLAVGASAANTTTRKATDFRDYDRTAWYAEAVSAAVDNGLLYGKSSNIIEPNGDMTRAEMAAIRSTAHSGATKRLTFRSIRTYPRASGITKMLRSPSRWVLITRAQFFLNGTRFAYHAAGSHDGRCPRTGAGLRFVLQNRSVRVLRPQRDFQLGAALCALDGRCWLYPRQRKTLAPLDNITRSEFAQIFYNIIGTYIVSKGTYDKDIKGSVLIRTDDVELKNLTVDGDLIIGCGAADGKITLDNVTIKGRLLVWGGGVQAVYCNNGTSTPEVIAARVDDAVKIIFDRDSTLAVIDTIKARITERAKQNKETEIIFYDVSGLREAQKQLNAIVADNQIALTAPAHLYALAGEAGVKAEFVNNSKSDTYKVEIRKNKDNALIVDAFELAAGKSISTLTLLEAPEFGNTDCTVTITAFRDGKQIGTLNTELTLHTAYLWPKEVQ